MKAVELVHVALCVHISVVEVAVCGGSRKSTGRGRGWRGERVGNGEENFFANSSTNQSGPIKLMEHGTDTKS